MKRAKFLTAWTDYPFSELGDVPGEGAPVRHVRILSYDGNKYCKVGISALVPDGEDWYEDEFEFFVKRAYLYRQKGRLGQVKQISTRKLEVAFGFTKGLWKHVNHVRNR